LMKVDAGSDKRFECALARSEDKVCKARCEETKGQGGRIRFECVVKDLRHVGATSAKWKGRERVQ